MSQQEQKKVEGYSDIARPRPFHAPMRELQEEPDANEPTISSYNEYDNSTFLNDDFYLRRKSGGNRRMSKSSTGSGTSSKIYLSAPNLFNENPPSSSRRISSNGQSVILHKMLHSNSKNPSEVKVLDSSENISLKVGGQKSVVPRSQSQSSIIICPDENDFLPPNNRSQGLSGTFGNNKFASFHSDSSMPIESQVQNLPSYHQRSKSADTPVDKFAPNHYDFHQSTNSKGAENGHYFKRKDANNTKTRRVHQLAQREKMRILSSHELDELDSGYGVGFGGFDSLSDDEDTVDQEDCRLPDEDQHEGIEMEILDQNKSYSSSKVIQMIDSVVEDIRHNRMKKHPKLILSNMNLTCKDIICCDRLYESPLKELLYKLSLARNNLVKIPPQLVQGELSALETLNLQQCQLVYLPKNWEFPSLKRLDLSHNKLCELDESTFRNLHNLEVLNLYDNEIHDLNLPTLEHLNSLNIGFNNLSKLPTNLPSLVGLKELMVGSNYIVEVSKEVVCDMNLKILEVTPNPLERPPLATCERGIDAMRRHYESFEANDTVQKSSKRKAARRGKKSKEKVTTTVGIPSPSLSILSDSVITFSSYSSYDDGFVEQLVNNTLRVIVVGSAMVGKTSCINGIKSSQNMKSEAQIQGSNLRRKVFHPERTIGVDISQWGVADLSDESQNLKINFWDFAGQEVYHGTHELFFSLHSLYVLCWDMGCKLGIDQKKNTKKQTNPAIYLDRDMLEEEKRVRSLLLQHIDENVQYWIDCIQSSAPGAAILIVATHSDLLDKIEVEKRCRLMKERIARHEANRVFELTSRLNELTKNHLAACVEADRLRRLVRPSNRPKLIYGHDDNVSCVSSTDLQGFDNLRESIMSAATRLFRSHVGTKIPTTYQIVESEIKRLRCHSPIISFSRFIKVLNEENLPVENEDKVVDALHFLSNNGEVCFFWDLVKSEKNNFSKLEVEKNVGIPISDQIIFLDPHWLVEAVASIVRHDLELKLRECDSPRFHKIQVNPINTNCPFLSNEETRLLWDSNIKMKQGVQVACSHSYITKSDDPYSFLERILISFNILVPVNPDTMKDTLEGTPLETYKEKKLVYFLPSLLKDSAAEPWDYKKTQSWQTTLCTSWRLLDFVPPGLFEKVISLVLRELWSLVYGTKISTNDNNESFHQIKPLQIHCWKKAFLLELLLNDGNKVHIFSQLTDRESVECVATNSMEVGEKRLLVSARGPLGKSSGSPLYKGGFSFVLGVIDKVMDKYGGLPFEKEGVCPKCLFFLPSRSDAKVWKWQFIRSAMNRGVEQLVCDIGHGSDTKLIGGDIAPQKDHRPIETILNRVMGEIRREIQVPLQLAFGSIVLIAFWDERKGRLVATGSGFIANSSKGLIVTAAHCIVDSHEFAGTFCQIFIGILPKLESGKYSTQAIFRYRAEVVEHDKNYQVDACVLKIITKLEHDMTISDAERPIDLVISSKNRKFYLNETTLPDLKTTSNDPEIGDFVHILGFDQGTRAFSYPMNTSLDCPIGRIRSLWSAPISTTLTRSLGSTNRKDRFTQFIKKEIKVQGDTSFGHSGGPCCNFRGEVIGIVTRAEDEHSNCYIAPSSEWFYLLARASARIP